jgi:hypothetical protein
MNVELKMKTLGDELVIRLNPEQSDESWRKNIRGYFDFSGRPMRGLIFVDAKGLIMKTG